MLESEFEQKYDKFVEGLFYFSQYDKFHKLKTESNKEFGIFRNYDSSIIIRPITEISDKLTITKKELVDVACKNKTTYIKEYEDTIIDYIRNNRLNDSKLCKYSGYYNSFITKNENPIIENKQIEKTKKALKTIKIKNIILYGSPGVGKTYNTNKLINLINNGKSKKKIFKTIEENRQNDNENIDDIKDKVKFITFHQSFGYEDFIEGFRPNKKGKIKLQNGIFKQICKDADKDRENSYYLVIDEINRGNISKIFGELITLIEEDKRDKLEVILPYSKTTFKIPSNLYIIGTMNSTDKSIALIDIALRRRFTFLKMTPNSDLINNAKSKEIFTKLNKFISKSHLGEDYQIGHSYFMKIENDDDLDFVLEYKIEPLLEEYFYGDKENLNKALKLIENES